MVFDVVNHVEDQTLFGAIAFLVGNQASNFQLNTSFRKILAWIIVGVFAQINLNYLPDATFILQIRKTPSRINLTNGLPVNFFDFSKRLARLARI